MTGEAGICQKEQEKSVIIESNAIIDPGYGGISKLCPKIENIYDNDDQDQWHNDCKKSNGEHFQVLEVRIHCNSLCYNHLEYYAEGAIHYFAWD